MRILVALDGSELSEGSLSAIAKWAWGAQAEIHLLSVVHPDEIHDTPSGEKEVPGDFSTVRAVGSSGQYGGALYATPKEAPILAEDRGEALKRVHDERMDYLQLTAAQYLQDMVVTCHVELSENTADAIVGVAEAVEADVIAIATHGRSGLSRALLGSVAEAVVRESKVPVVLIGPAMTVELKEAVPPLEPVKHP